jgi:anaerobic magnesium-protoporphyrin IX monomethyl ester cyclase
LGLLYIASNLREVRGDEVRVIDAFCANLTPEQLLEEVRRERPDLVGMNCSTHTFLEAMRSLEMVRQELPEVKILLGGYHATFATEHILKDYRFIDYIIKGEAENAFVKLLDHIEKGEEPADVEGISYLKGELVVSNPISLVLDLDSLPFPDRKLVSNIEYGYSLEGIPLTFGKFTTICSSRGCPFKCSYCSCAAFSLRKWRPRSPENVVEELESMYSDGYESCVFVDDNFTHDPKRALRITELVRQRRIRMQLYCEGRVDSASAELMLAMKKAGFNVIYFGAESASQGTLEYYHKHITPEKTRKAIENAKRAGMLVVTSYIVGAPVESREDVRQTIDFIHASRPHAVQVNILDCLVGTGIWEELVREGKVQRDDWRTNHRIYEYYPDHMGKEELEHLVNEAYGQWLKGWWSREGLSDILRILYKNQTARRVVFSNLFNPNVRKRITEGMQVFDDPLTMPERAKSG